MKALQLHVDFIEYEPISIEGRIYEETSKGRRRLEDVVVLFTSVEEGDSEESVRALLGDVAKHMSKLGVDRLLIYPYAHLSDKLASPTKALDVLKLMEKIASDMGLRVVRAPFGWNKQFTISVKGHPLAEQFRSTTGYTQATRSGATQVAIKREAQAHTSIAALRGREPTHISLGRQLDIFSISEEAGSGFPLYHPRGFIIREELIKYIREVNAELGFREVWTPHILRSELWYRTGHYETYRERMFTLEVDGDEYVVKPMNCPAHALIYSSRPRSYRELPIALSEFGTVYRNEQSGELTGLLRVRAITQDDGHVFLRPDQIEGVVAKIIRSALRVLDTLIGGGATVNLSTRPEKFIGDVSTWERATDALKRALDSLGVDYVVKEGEGAFYGPKVDVDVQDSLGRRWQCSTIQLDFFMPERLGLEYIDPDGRRRRPVMIHRALLGSIDRFMALLLENYGGRLPFWLSPEHVRIIPISARHLNYARLVFSELSEFRASLDEEGVTLEKKIRRAHADRVNFVVIVGDREVNSGTISVRDASGKTHSGLSLGAFKQRLRELRDKRVRNVGYL